MVGSDASSVMKKSPAHPTYDLDSTWWIDDDSGDRIEALADVSHIFMYRADQPIVARYCEGM